MGRTLPGFCLLLVACCCLGAARGRQQERPGAHTCKELFFEGQRVDHFNARTQPQQWSQRYLLNDTYWRGRGRHHKGPIFFYAGNEAAVEGYADHTGLMWENAERFGALLVFAEHRYYGSSQPLGEDSIEVDPSFFTVEQAMADYALLAVHLQQSLDARSSPIIVFGGSYGGMLAAWLRMRYPHIFTGAIAASAPVGAFVSDLTSFDPSSFWAAVTHDATPKAGAAKGCAANSRRSFEAIFGRAGNESGRAELSTSFGLCPGELEKEEDVETLAYWIQGAFDSYAMGNYPYPSDYIAGRAPDAPLPAWPMRAACKHLGGSFASDADLLQGMKRAMDVLYNVTGDQSCYKLELTGPAGGPEMDTYLYLWCSQAVGQELPFFPSRGGKHDMFWDQGRYNQSKINADCQRSWGVTPRPDHLPMTFGGLDVQYASNIVWSNGGMDPWHVAGVLSDPNPSLDNVAVWIAEGAHHLDLMFSHPDDPGCVRRARNLELEYIQGWVGRHYSTTIGAVLQQGDTTTAPRRHCRSADAAQPLRASGRGEQVSDA